MTQPKKKLPSGTASALIVLAAVVLGVNAYMVVVSLASQSELVVEDYYGESLKYDSLHAQTEKGNQLGLTLTLDKSPGVVAFRLGLGDAGPNEYTSAYLEFYRPSDSQRDFQAPLSWDQGTGSYVTQPLALMSGRWKVAARLKTEAGEAQKIFEVYL